MNNDNNCFKSGALLACGIVNCGIRNECDPALALLSDYILHNSNVMRLGAIVGKFSLKLLIDWMLLFSFPYHSLKNILFVIME